MVTVVLLSCPWIIVKGKNENGNNGSFQKHTTTGGGRDGVYDVIMLTSWKLNLNIVDDEIC